VLSIVLLVLFGATTGAVGTRYVIDLHVDFFHGSSYSGSEVGLVYVTVSVPVKLPWKKSTCRSRS